MSRVPESVDRNELYVVARRVLLDALVALRDQSDAVTIVGAQAIYLRSIDVELAVASFTSDADLGLDPDRLADVPLLEGVMTAAGFVRDVADHAGHGSEASGWDPPSPTSLWTCWCLRASLEVDAAA